MNITPNHTLFAVALNNRNGMTKKHMREEVKKLGLSPIAAHVEALGKKIKELGFLRSVSQANRLANKIGYAKLAFCGRSYYFTNYNTGKAAPKKNYKTETINERLENFKKKKIYPEMPNFRFDQNPKIIFSTTKNPTVSQVDYLDWDYYSKSTKYPKKVVNTTFYLRPDWSKRVLNNGLANLGGMFTLDAAELEAPSGARLFAASWVSQGRGYTLHVNEGYIALAGGTEFHAKTADKAIKGVEKKIRQKGLSGMYAEMVDNLAATAQKYPELTVSVADAKAAGACDSGIRSWCYRVGIDAQSVSIERMAEAYALDPAAYARAAIVTAIRRQKKLLAPRITPK